MRFYSKSSKQQENAEYMNIHIPLVFKKAYLPHGSPKMQCETTRELGMYTVLIKAYRKTVTSRLKPYDF